MTYYKVGTIQEENAKDEQDMDDVIMLYRLAILVAGKFAQLDEYAVKAQEALWRLAALGGEAVYGAWGLFSEGNLITF